MRTPQGKVKCDKCGEDLNGAHPGEAVTVTLLDADGNHDQMHFGLDKFCGCAYKVFNKTHLAYRLEKHEAFTLMGR